MIFLLIIIAFGLAAGWMLYGADFMATGKSYRSSQEKIRVHRAYTELVGEKTFTHATVGPVYLTDVTDEALSSPRELDFMDALLTLEGKTLQITNEEGEILFESSVNDASLMEEEEFFFVFFADNLVLVATGHYPFGLPLNKRAYMHGQRRPTVDGLWGKFIPTRAI